MIFFGCSKSNLVFSELSTSVAKAYLPKAESLLIIKSWLLLGFELWSLVRNVFVSAIRETTWTSVLIEFFLFSSAIRMVVNTKKFCWTFLSLSLSIYKSIDWSISLSQFISISLSIYCHLFISICLSIAVCSYLSIYLSIIICMYVFLSFPVSLGPFISIYNLPCLCFSFLYKSYVNSIFYLCFFF